MIPLEDCESAQQTEPVRFYEPRDIIAAHQVAEVLGYKFMYFNNRLHVLIPLLDITAFHQLVKENLPP